MLQNVPKLVGHALEGVRAGMRNVVFFETGIADIPEIITVESAAFHDGGALPQRFTDDGAGLSPPLGIHGVPPKTAALILIVEDADSPTPHPLVHAIAWNLPGHDQTLAEGAIKSRGSQGRNLPLGKNSFLAAEYLPPDPPPGHGPHRYLFQAFALDAELELDEHPGRCELLEAMTSHVVAKGCMIGTYERA
jgi:Raf kinase inhibitor-like YbhB/YbcL family protein